MTWRRLTTRIVLLANGVPAAERALAAMVAGANRSAHGFRHRFLVGVGETLEDSRFTGLLDRVAMDPRAAGQNPAAGIPRQIDDEPEVYKFVVQFLDREEPGEGGTLVELKVVTSSFAEDKSRYQELVNWLGARPDSDERIRGGLWILAGDEEKIPSHGGGNDRAESAVFLHPKLIGLAEKLLTASPGQLETVVVSVIGFEYFLLDSYQENAPNSLRRPLDLAFDKDIVRKIAVALVRGAPLFCRLILRCSAWQAQPAPTTDRKRLALLQPISANGFFADDGAPNVDRDTGYTLLTPEGMIEDRGIEGGPFPSDDLQLPYWTPYLAADPIMEIVLGELGTLAMECRDIEKDLPRLGYSPSAVAN